MASLDDILTTQKNGVVGINGLTQAFLRYIGTNTTTALGPSDAGAIVTGAGRVVNVSVIDGGSADGVIYNASSYSITSPPPDSAKLATISQTAGVYQLNVMFTSGIVVVPGTGQLVAITYSIG